MRRQKQQPPLICTFAVGLAGILAGCSSFLILGKAVDHCVFIYRMT